MKNLLEVLLIMLNPYKVVKIKKVDEKHNTHSKFVYDLEIEDNHNFFANKILSSNCHHFPAPESKKFLINNTFRKMLFLTATLERADGEEEFLLNDMKIPIIYSYSQEDAITDKLLNEFDLVCEGVDFNDEEQEEYNKIQGVIKKHFPNYAYDYTIVLKRAKIGDFKAAELSRAFALRKKLIFNADNKVATVVDIINNHKDDKIIIFTEEIGNAYKIYNALKDDNLVGIYQSSVSIAERKQTLEKFKEGFINILVSCKCLDEGLDVPTANVAVIVSGNSTSRQSIQRVGRVIRYYPNKKSYVYMLYVRDSKEQDWLKERINALSYKNIEWR